MDKKQTVMSDKQNKGITYHIPKEASKDNLDILNGDSSVRETILFINGQLFYFAQREYEHHIESVHRQLGGQPLEPVWDEGTSMTTEQAVAFDFHGNQLETAQPLADPLTERELEILRLLASGCSTHEIAQQLVLSTGTVRWYLKHIFSKLDAHSRAQAIARARDFNLLP